MHLCFSWQSGCGWRANTNQRAVLARMHSWPPPWQIWCSDVLYFWPKLVCRYPGIPFLTFFAVLLCTVEMLYVRTLQRACPTCAEWRCEGMSPAKEHGEDCCRIHKSFLSHALLAMLIIPLALCWIA